MAVAADLSWRAARSLMSVLSGQTARSVASQLMASALPAELGKPCVAFAQQLLAPLLGVLLLKLIQDTTTLTVVLPLIATSAAALQHTQGKSKADRRRLRRAHARCVLARKILVRGTAVLLVYILITVLLTYHKPQGVKSEFQAALQKLQRR